MRILVVEKEQELTEELTPHFGRESYATEVERTAKDALRRVQTEKFDVVLLGLPLYDGDMFEILSNIRNLNVETSILIAAQPAGDIDHVTALNAGADAYLHKPIIVDELMARIRALLRRADVHRSLYARVGDLKIDLIKRSARRANIPVRLTPKEFDCLVYLIQRKQQVVTREELAREVWQETRSGKKVNNLIDVFVAKLRRKIDSGRSMKLIRTVRGTGFVLHDE